MEMPETRYAETADGVSIAYQVVGDGPPDVSSNMLRQQRESYR